MEPKRVEVDGVVWWERNCPECGKIIRHTKGYNARKLSKAGSWCKPCRFSGNGNNFYGRKHSDKMKVEHSKRFSGKGNPMYGIGGMLGKAHSELTKKKMARTQTIWWRNRGANPPAFAKYRNQVDKVTRNQPIHLLENFDKRGVAGVRGAYHLDHITSVWYGFQNNILSKKIGHISNLRMIPWLENQKKWLYNEAK